MKYKSMAITVSLVFVPLAAVLTRITPVLVQAASSRSVGATVKISICGNEVAEGGEDCDNSDLANQTCIGLGYAGGDLKCDIACGFDLSSCISATPIPAPKPPLPPSLSTFDVDRNGRIELEELYQAVKQWVDEWRKALLEEITAMGGGAIESAEGKKCDINDDGKCNLKDFSILMYYVEE